MDKDVEEGKLQVRAGEKGAGKGQLRKGLTKGLEMGCWGGAGGKRSTRASSECRGS